MAFDIYTAVTDRIIDQLEKGEIPWNKPWAGLKSGAFSRSTGRAYSLLNQLMLGQPGEYATFNQIKQAGGKVKKGAKAKMVVFWKQVKVSDTDDSGQTVEKLVPMLRYFQVFHIENDCENIAPKHKPEDMKPFDPIAEAEEVFASYLARSGVGFENAIGNRAFYRPSTDRITLPLKDQFATAQEYYSTLYHEATHSTGHSSRLNRLDKIAAHGDGEYSREELVAEIGAAACLNRLGIETPSTFKNSTAYIQSWLKALRNDKRLIVSAAGKAEKAVALIFGE